MAVQAGILLTVVTEMPRTVTAQQICTLIECPTYNALRCLLAQVISSLTSSPSVHGELNVCVTEFHMNSGLHVRTHIMLCSRVSIISAEKVAVSARDHRVNLWTRSFDGTETTRWQQ